MASLEFRGKNLFAKFCNHMNGTFSLQDNTLSVGAGLASTKMLCHGQIMDIEGAFAFQSAQYQLNAERTTLTLTTDAGDVLTFVKQ